MTRAARTALTAAVVALALTGCAAPVVFSAPMIIEQASRPEAPQPIDLSDPGSGAGAVLSAQTMPNLPWTATRSGMNSARVVHVSQTADGASTEVSASVFTPSGDAPDGGWPVVSFGHGTTGIESACAPSLSRNLLGLADLAAGFTQAGYAVAIADYQGLGHPGVHPYLDNPTAGYNMIDAVRALRNTFPDVSNRWVAFGGSQGGGAAWAANEQADYAPELELLGSVSLAPGADMTGLVDKAGEGTLTDDQAPLMQWVLESLARTVDGFDLDRYRSASVAEDWDALTDCTPAQARARGDAVTRIEPKSFAPRSPAAEAVLRDSLARMAVPQQQASAPMLVVYGDADSYIDVEWTDAALARACALGDVIEIDRQPGKGHADIDGDEVNRWIGERFSGEPAVNDCRP